MCGLHSSSLGMISVDRSWKVTRCTDSAFACQYWAIFVISMARKSFGVQGSLCVKGNHQRFFCHLVRAVFWVCVQQNRVLMFCFAMRLRKLFQFRSQIKMFLMTDLLLKIEINFFIRKSSIKNFKFFQLKKFYKLF